MSRLAQNTPFAILSAEAARGYTAAVESEFRPEVVVDDEKEEKSVDEVAEVIFMTRHFACIHKTRVTMLFCSEPHVVWSQEAAALENAAAPMEE